MRINGFLLFNSISIIQWVSQDKFQCWAKCKTGTIILMERWQTLLDVVAPSSPWKWLPTSSIGKVCEVPPRLKNNVIKFVSSGAKCVCLNTHSAVISERDICMMSMITNKKVSRIFLISIMMTFHYKGSNVPPRATRYLTNTNTRYETPSFDLLIKVIQVIPKIL